MCVHVFVDRSQLSAVHTMPSPHCASLVQQPMIGVNVHVCSVVLHASLVHALLSLQSLFVAQQPVIGVFTHVFVARLQTSIVHALPSSHCVLFVHVVPACV